MPVLQVDSHIWLIGGTDDGNLTAFWLYLNQDI